MNHRDALSPYVAIAHLSGFSFSNNYLVRAITKSDEYPSIAPCQEISPCYRVTDYQPGGNFKKRDN